MKRVGIYVVALALCVGAFVLLRQKRDPVAILEFSWSIDGKDVPVGFIARNRSDHPVACAIVLIATNIRESRVGTRIAPIGVSRMPIALAAHEEKKMQVILHLSDAANSETAITYSLE